MEVSQEIGLLSVDGLDEMEAISGQSSEGKIGLMALIGFGEPSEAESIGNDKGIYLVCLLLIGVSPFEVSDELWIQLIDGGFKGSQILRGGQKVDQMEIEEGGCLCGDF